MRRLYHYINREDRVAILLADNSVLLLESEASKHAKTSTNISNKQMICYMVAILHDKYDTVSVVEYLYQ
jgi:hypothetical protein